MRVTINTNSLVSGYRSRSTDGNLMPVEGYVQSYIFSRTGRVEGYIILSRNGTNPVEFERIAILKEHGPIKHLDKE